MTITINNQPYNFSENSSLENAINILSLDETKGIAVAINEAIIPKNKWSETILQHEDKIIIIGAVAGG
ncbi:MAG: sulfur carrier protein ThiS [Chitinophagales bacterium]|nr:sulfur carrier protein ThiS [Bacteroidota bacterium]